MPSRLGYLAVCGAALLWALGATVIGDLLRRGASPLQLAAARMWITAAGLLLVVRAGRHLTTKKPRAPAIMYLAFGASIAGAVSTHYIALGRLPVAVALVIQYGGAALVVLWNSVTERRLPSPRIIVALAFALVGITLLTQLPAVVRGAVSLDVIGLAAAAASAVGFATYVLTGERLVMAIGPHRALAGGFTVSGVFWAIFIGSQGRPDTLLDPSFTAGILFVGVAATIVPGLLFFWGVARIGSSRAGIASTLEPPAGALFSFIALGQILRPAQLVGAAMVLAGIAVMQFERAGLAELTTDRRRNLIWSRHGSGP